LNICHAHNEVEQKCFWGCSPLLSSFLLSTPLAHSCCLARSSHCLPHTSNIQFQSHNRVSKQQQQLPLKAQSHSRVISPATTTTTATTVKREKRNIIILFFIIISCKDDDSTVNTFFR